ncbi:cytochrome B5-like protein isoform X2 [Panicum virgatum]|uniref:Cytochrome b5 heme-binding domain-containing protein n=1 Tax=Panicum virgatum TaxID=38727 RepID=A0A8T0VIF6_PANVG|nr:cytochrome B5-like protein isoform X2 [Panicum virgatum]KAG2634558.1 hypothetical protein PVAP13_2NG180100 [Panicum virgatum]KAG2634559.1 hypothetical protein PVAP13_2NG180100 [Panicum virgatum]KAG2634560.1 hypothetical protein PVAP13_2NG180100 [Panicum virgatum]
MEILIYVLFVVLLGLGALFVIPRSNSKGKGDAAHLAGSGKVYDVTAYVEEHPGGDDILNNAGCDSTEGFFGPQHGTRVFEIIEDFCTGRLKD